MSSANSPLNRKIGFTLIAVLSIAAIVLVSQTASVNALSKYFNCTTKKANNNSQFGIQDALTCYDKVFKGAQTYANETYQNPDMNNLTSFSQVKPAKSISSSTTAAHNSVSFSNDNQTGTIPKSNSGSEMIIYPIKSTTPPESPTTKHVSKTVPDHKAELNLPSKANIKDQGPDSGINLNTNKLSNYESFDLPFTAVIPR